MTAVTTGGLSHTVHVCVCVCAHRTHVMDEHLAGRGQAWHSVTDEQARGTPVLSVMVCRPLVLIDGRSNQASVHVRPRADRLGRHMDPVNQESLARC